MVAGHFKIVVLTDTEKLLSKKPKLNCPYLLNSSYNKNIISYHSHFVLFAAMVPHDEKSPK